MNRRIMLACCVLACTTAVAAPGAAPAPAKPATPGGFQQPPLPSEATIALNLKNTPLRQALAMVFGQLGLQYSIAANVPDLPMTVMTREIPFEMALRTLLRLADNSGANVTYSRLGDVYQIHLRTPEPPSQPAAVGFPTLSAPRPEDIQAEKIPVDFIRPSDAVSYLTEQPVPGIKSIEPLTRDNSVVVRGDPDAIQQLKRLLQLADVPSRPLTLTVGISGPGLNGTPLAIRSSARTLIGDDLTIAEEAATSGQPAHLQVKLKTQLLGTGDLQVASDWDVSVPIAGGPRGPIRLVKRLSTTTEARPGEQVPVAEVDLAGWGGKGVLRLWIRGEWGRRDQARRSGLMESKH